MKEVSGQRLVPVIDDRGRVVFDSTMILRYLEERYPEPPLYPREQAQRAALDNYLDWFNRVCKRPPNEIESELLAQNTDQQRVEALAAWMTDNLDFHERLLAGRDYLFGDDFSAADCAAFPFLKYALVRDPEDDELFHRIPRRAPVRQRSTPARGLDPTRREAAARLKMTAAALG